MCFPLFTDWFSPCLSTQSIINQHVNETSDVKMLSCHKRKFICEKPPGIFLLKVIEIRKQCKDPTATPHPLLISHSHRHYQMHTLWDTFWAFGDSCISNICRNGGTNIPHTVHFLFYFSVLNWLHRCLSRHHFLLFIVSFVSNQNVLR